MCDFTLLENKKSLNSYFSVPAWVIKSKSIPSSTRLLLAICFNEIEHSKCLVQKNEELKYIYSSDEHDTIAYIDEATLLSCLNISKKQMSRLAASLYAYGITLEKKCSNTLNGYIYIAYFNDISMWKDVKDYIYIPYFIFNKSLCLSNSSKVFYLLVLRNLLYNSYKYNKSVAKFNYEYMSEFFSKSTIAKCCNELASSGLLCCISKLKRSNFVQAYNLYGLSKTELSNFSISVKDAELYFQEDYNTTLDIIENLTHIDDENIVSLETNLRDKAELSKEFFEISEENCDFSLDKLFTNNILLSNFICKRIHLYNQISLRLKDRRVRSYLHKVVKSQNLSKLKDTLIKQLCKAGIEYKLSSIYISAYMLNYLLYLTNNFYDYIKFKNSKIGEHSSIVYLCSLNPLCSFIHKKLFKRVIVKGNSIANSELSKFDIVNPFAYSYAVIKDVFDNNIFGIYKDLGYC